MQRKFKNYQQFLNYFQKNRHIYLFQRVFWTVFFFNQNVMLVGVKNLIGEPDYKSVKLHWEAEAVNDDAFLVRYCELQSWGAQRCRTKKINEPDNNRIDSEEYTMPYSANISGLRMATTYSFEIKPANESNTRKNRASSNNKNENMIVIPTKGCKCVGN